MRKPFFITITVLLLMGAGLITMTHAVEKLFENKLDALKADPKEQYWMVVFTFGPDETEAVPYLMKYIDNEDKNIRYNAIIMLGNWLLAYESKEQLKSCYWKEKDPEIKVLLLSCLESLMTNLAESKEFFTSVTTKETDAKARDYAKETLSLFDTYKTNMGDSLKNKEINPEKFKTEYKLLYKSYGQEGQYENLMKYSTFKDEGSLRRLKERILERESDEALHDYKKINYIILMNRFIKDNDVK
jgi:hypothetical protein